MPNKKIKITPISLGYACKPATFRKSLGYAKQVGYKTCPFDLMVTNLNGIIDCLNTDFKYFCDPKFLEITDLGNENGEERFMIRNTKYEFLFNHESFNRGEAYLYERENWENGAYMFVNNNFEKLVERYTKRIDNFIKYCESSDYVNFLLMVDNEASVELIDELNLAIKNRFPKLKYGIFIEYLDAYSNALKIKN